MNMHACPKAAINWRNHHHPEYNFIIVNSASDFSEHEWVTLTIALGKLRLVKLTKISNYDVATNMLAYYLMGKIILRKDQSFTSSKYCVLFHGTFYLSSGLMSPVSQEELLISNIWFQHSVVSGYYSLSNVQINL